MPIEAIGSILDCRGGFLAEFDTFLQTDAFRCLHMKLPLEYYKNFALVFLKLPNQSLDWLYADMDMFIASWLPSKRSPNVSCNNYSHKTLGLFGDSFGVVLLADYAVSTHTFAMIYSEDQLALMYFRCTVILKIGGLPASRCEREQREEDILQEFEDYLSSTEFKMYFRETFRDTVRSVQEGGATSTATLGLSSTVSTLGHATAGFALTLAVDVAITVRAVSKARKRHKAGEISDREFKTTVKRKVRQTSCQLVGGSTGSMIGQIVLPVPVIGAMIGGFVGSLIGTGLSKGMDKIEEVRELKKPVKDLIRRGDVSPVKTKNMPPVGAKNLYQVGTKNLFQVGTKNLPLVETKNMSPDGTKNVSPAGTKNQSPVGAKNVNEGLKNIRARFRRPSWKKSDS